MRPGAPSKNLTEHSVFEVKNQPLHDISTQTRHAHCDIQHSDAPQCQGGDVSLRRGSEEEETPRAKSSRGLFGECASGLQHGRRKASQQSQPLEERSRQRPSLNPKKAETCHVRSRVATESRSGQDRRVSSQKNSSAEFSSNAMS